jgi:hypothetical protein
VLNLDEAVRAFQDAHEAFGVTPLKECLMPLAYRVRDRAKQLVRRDKDAHPPQYPHLQDAIFAAWGKPDHPSAIVGVDRKKAPHAHLVEFGHGGPHPAGPHPYLRPALDSMKAAAVALMGMEINQRIIRKLTAKRGGLAKP